MSRYIQIVNSLGADGLGFPSVSVYFSICDKKEVTGCYCKNCQNEELQEHNIGSDLTKKERIETISKKLTNLTKLIKSKPILVFLGGEPLSSYNENYVRDISKHFIHLGFETMVYTWRTEEDLQSEKKDISDFTYVVCGEYIEELKDENYILGSTNQYIITNK